MNNAFYLGQIRSYIKNTSMVDNDTFFIKILKYRFIFFLAITQNMKFYIIVFVSDRLGAIKKLFYPLIFLLDK